MFEIITFRLAQGVDEATFRAADTRVQVEFAYHQPGFLRRTLGRQADRWLILQVWASGEAAEAASTAFDAAPVGAELMALIDVSSLSVERFAGVD